MDRLQKWIQDESRHHAERENIPPTTVEAPEDRIVTLDGDQEVPMDCFFSTVLGGRSFRENFVSRVVPFLVLLSILMPVIANDFFF